MGYAKAQYDARRIARRLKRLIFADGKNGVHLLETGNRVCDVRTQRGVLEIRLLTRGWLPVGQDQQFTDTNGRMIQLEGEARIWHCRK